MRADNIVFPYIFILLGIFLLPAIVVYNDFKQENSISLSAIIREDENGNIIDLWKVDSSSFYYENEMIEFEIKSNIDIDLDSNNVTIIKDLKEEETNYEEYHKYEDFILSQNNSKDKNEGLDDLNTIIIKSDLNGDITDIWKVNKEDYNYMDDGFVSFKEKGENEIVIDSKNIVVLKNLSQKESSLFEEYHKHE